MSQPGKTIAVSVLSNNPKKKTRSENEIWSFIRIQNQKQFYEKSCTKCSGVTIPRSFSKN